MEKPDTKTKALLIAQCMTGILASPEAWRQWEHERGENEGFMAWAARKAEKSARNIWRIAAGDPG